MTGTGNVSKAVRVIVAVFLLTAAWGCQQMSQIQEDIPEQLPNPVRDFTQKDRYMIGLSWYRQQNYEIAAKFWKPMAMEGDCDAEYAMGLLYLGGLGVWRSYEDAFTLWERSANQGQAQAQISLGIMYAHGSVPYTVIDCKKGCGVERDLVEAYKWLSVALEIGAPSEKEMAADYLARISPLMTPEQTSEGDSLAKAWKPDPAQCDPRGVFLVGP
ncbi:MAG: sel1 repeat family protein [Candidatus Dadabacteria bacterium]|nr:sel1 repeat family protein [Candidatus Dadabacteria bacterium]